MRVIRWGMVKGESRILLDSASAERMLRGSAKPNLGALTFPPEADPPLAEESIPALPVLAN